MDITYLGHSSFKIKGKTTSLVTDPFDSSVGFKYPKVSADIITVSHDHGDHNNTDQVTGARKIISGPGEYEIAGVSIVGFKTFHDDKKGKLRGKNTVYMIEIDGFRLVHMGDLGHKLSQRIIEMLGDVDVVMIPVGGEYTIDHGKAVSVVQDIQPSIVIPMHYQVKGLDQKVFSKLTGSDEFVKDLGLSVEKLDKLSIKTGSVLIDQKIVILQRK